MAKKIINILGMVLVFSSLSLWAQEDYRSRIAIVPMENGTGLEQYNPLCSTISDTVSLVLEFLKEYRVLDEQDADLVRLEAQHDLSTLGSIAREEGIDEIIFGRAVIKDDVFEFTLSLYNVKERKITNRQVVEAYSVLEVFDAADELTEGLISQLSNVNIAFGSINLVQTGGKGNYTVNLDGFSLRNPDKTFQKVLNGVYDVSISQKRLVGRKTVLQESVRVKEDEELLLEFAIPPGLPEEFEWIEERGEALLVLGQSPGMVDQFLEEITLFQNETLALEYDPELEGLRDRYLEEAGVLAVAVLQSRMDEADSSFYREDSSLDETLGTYQDISTLVQTSFDTVVLSSSGDRVISLPDKLEYSESGKVFFSCRDEYRKAMLMGWDPEDGSVVSRSLNSRARSFSGDFISREGHLYLWEPESDKVEVLNEDLETLESLPLPGIGDVPESLKLAVSERGLLYILSGKLLRVIDTDRSFDDKGRLLPPDRYPAIEEKLNDLMARIGEAHGKTPGDAFFDEARHLNIFFPGSGMLYISDENGILLKEIFLEGSYPDSRIAADKAGYFYVSLPEENSIAKYTAAGERITTYGSYGTEEGQFSLPAGVAVSPEGILYVADSYNARIQSLKPLTPPLLYPEIARYGGDLERRIERTEIAAVKEQSARDIVTRGKHFKNLLGTGGFFLGAGLLAVLADESGAQSAYSGEIARISVDPEEISHAESDEESEAGVHAITEYGSMALLGVSASYLTISLLDIGMEKSLARYNREQARLLDMDTLYETDPELYRSVRTSSQIGIWTGIAPPVLGIGITFAMTQIEMDSPEMLALGVTAFGVGIPPIFSHLHGGRFSPGLMIAGLSADILAIVALSNMGKMNMDWGYQEYSSYESNPDPYNDPSFRMDRMLDRIDNLTTLYLIAAAYGVRLAAGIYDARYGWTYTNNYNRYRAVREIEKEKLSEWNVGPYIGRQGGLGLAVNLSF